MIFGIKIKRLLVFAGPILLLAVLGEIILFVAGPTSLLGPVLLAVMALLALVLVLTLLREKASQAPDSAAQETIARYARELERSNQDLQVFASAASHDLQEPLRKIESFGQRLEEKYDEVLDDSGRVYLSRMIDASGRMRRLIDALLTFSRVNDQNTQISDVDLEGLCKGVLVDSAARIKATQARIDVSALPVIEADETQMRIIFDNLLGNALTYQPAGQAPEISVQVFDPGDAAQIGIRVRDNGIGFDPKYSERIFEMFERLHSRSEFEGSGIGLAICAKIVERHGGSLRAQSIPGQGAEFSLILPKHQ
ncbi:MAG: ATP-binding protein [Pseudomonadota bacterium]|nr:ATP-binding protein [Pseudomonadota bacterium]